MNFRAAALALLWLANAAHAQSITVSPTPGLLGASGAITCTAAGVCTLNPLSVTAGGLGIHNQGFKLSYSGAIFSDQGNNSNLFVGDVVGLQSGSIGFFNTIFGLQSGGNILDVGSSGGHGNSFFGQSAGKAVTTGNGNNLFGNNAGVVITTGSNNECVGVNSCLVLTTGSGNNAIGTNALMSVTTGSNNTANGSGATGPTTASNSTILGANINIGNVGSAVAIGIGDGTVEADYALTTTGTWTLAGKLNVSALTTAAGTPSSICQNSVTKEITVNAALTCTVSSLMFKHDFEPLNRPALPLVMAMAPGAFFYNDSAQPRIGFASEYMAAIDPRFGDAWDNGQPRSIDQNAILAVVVKALQELKADNDNLREEIRRRTTAP